jgi:mediator of RNA polymerase II transcription subunit 16
VSHARNSRRSETDQSIIAEVVEALCGCAKWSLDLLSWLTDSLFSLLDDPKFMALLNPQRFSEMTNYLQTRSDVSLHLLLCSSTRGFLSAVCRRILHLEQISKRAIDFYERRASMQNVSDPSTQSKVPHVLLYKAYQKMHRVTTGSLIKVQEFEKLLGVLSADIRSAYQTSLASFGAKNLAQGQQLGGKAMETAIKSAQLHCELNMLLASSPPPAFVSVLLRFFNNSLKNYKTQTDPAKLFFADFDLLEVDDDRKSLAAKKAQGRYVDVFKRIDLMAPRAGEGEGVSNSVVSQWRRCVRCAAVMEDVFGARPGFTFVLAQQRKCSCGGHWGLVPRSAFAR